MFRKKIWDEILWDYENLTVEFYFDFYKYYARSRAYHGQYKACAVYWYDIFDSDGDCVGGAVYRTYDAVMKGEINDRYFRRKMRD